MKKETKYFIVVLVIIAGVLGYIFSQTEKKNNEEEDGNTEIQQEQNENKEEEQESEDTNTDSNNTKEEEKEENTTNESTIDFSKYTAEAQTVGEDSESKYVIEGVSNTAKNGYHEVSFLLSSEDGKEPFVNASYISGAGVIRVQLNNITEDKTGIAYQSSKNIGVDGISKIYRNVSSVQDEEIYDIGVKPTVFRLESKKNPDGTWNVLVNIKYTSDTKTTDEDIDTGSKEFSKEEQKISGVGSDKNAAITSYTFGYESGILKFVWNVTSNGSSPIPSVKASYDDSGKLTVTFESLSSDKVASIGEIPLSTTIKLQSLRQGETSVYVFDGVKDGTEFRLSAGTNPNQVSIEIK